MMTVAIVTCVHHWCKMILMKLKNQGINFSKITQSSTEILKGDVILKSCLLKEWLHFRVIWSVLFKENIGIAANSLALRSGRMLLV